MSEARIGRLLVASLHQAIADILPTRLEFYENWLNVSGLREGTIGLGPLFAVLSFLRTEGTHLRHDHGPGRRVRGGVDGEAGCPAIERRLIGALPDRLCARARRCGRRGRMIRATYPGTRAIIRLRRGSASVDLRGSLFCEVRELTQSPLCGFYVAAIGRVLQLFALQADGRVHECRAAGVRRACTLNVVGRSCRLSTSRSPPARWKSS